MIKYAEGGLKDIWPDKQSPEVQALSFAIQNGLKTVKHYADRSRCYSSIDLLPESVLDYLAVEMRSMYYNQEADIEQKRNIIRNTMNWYTKAGTPSAVAEMVAVIFGTGEVIEWFNFDEPPYTPGTFDIETSAVMTASIMQDLTNIIRKVKNARSQLRRVVVIREAHAGMHAAIISPSVYTTVVPNHYKVTADNEMHDYVAAATSTESFTVARNDIHKAAEARSMQSQVSYAETEMVSSITNAREQSSAATQSNGTLAQISRITESNTIVLKEE